MPRPTAWAMLIAANVVFYCVLSFYGSSSAVAQGGKPVPNTFANAVEQRIQMINHLNDIKTLLQEQNALLQSGKVKVVVVESK